MVVTTGWKRDGLGRCWSKNRKIKLGGLSLRNLVYNMETIVNSNVCIIENC
jgi:hypothetical protein